MSRNHVVTNSLYTKQIEWSNDQFTSAKNYICDNNSIDRDNWLNNAGIKQIFNSYVFKVYQYLKEEGF